MGLEDATRNAVEKATKLGYIRATMKHPLTGLIQEIISVSIYQTLHTSLCPAIVLRLPMWPKAAAASASGNPAPGGRVCRRYKRYREVCGGFLRGSDPVRRHLPAELNRRGHRRNGKHSGESREGSGMPANHRLLASGGSRSENRNGSLSCAESSGRRDYGNRRLDIVFAVNVEYAYTHIAGICVAISCNCMVPAEAAAI